MRRFLRDNGLSLVLFFLFFLTFLFGQSALGMAEYNDDRREHHQPTVGYAEYLATGHFLEATMENWESEFLQMFAFIMLTTFLYQKGSAESKDPDGDNDVDRDPRLSKNKKNAPWPVRKGGLVLKLYENSLGLAFLLLFLLSFALHAVGGAAEYNSEQQEHGNAERVTAIGYAATSRFWFESLQNWQSEFLAIWCMVVFTIRLRQKGSPESKPVDAPHSQTGE
jgi:Na+-transporting methylmalonyl-CoA/oxaloacetate decarboxylase gamma subunit